MAKKETIPEEKVKESEFGFAKGMNTFIGKEVEYQTKGVLFEKGKLEHVNSHGFIFSNENEYQFFSHSAGVKIKIIK